MENNLDESIYIFYPVNFGRLNGYDWEDVMTYGFFVGNRPKLVGDGCFWGNAQVMKEEQVKNLGTENICKQILSAKNEQNQGHFDTCVVAKIPNIYLGCEKNKSIALSPILKKDVVNNADPKKKVNYYLTTRLIDGLYSTNNQIGGYISNPNYSKVIAPVGVFTEEQKEAMRYYGWRSQLDFAENIENKGSTYSVVTDKSQFDKILNYYRGYKNCYSELLKNPELSKKFYSDLDKEEILKNIQMQIRNINKSMI